MKTVDLIKKAFHSRTHPTRMPMTSESFYDELEDVREMLQLDWRDTTAEQWEKVLDCLSFFSPEAFCYFLPGLLIASLEDDSTDIPAVSSVLFMLESPTLDACATERWGRFTLEELCAIDEWLKWVTPRMAYTFEQSSLDWAAQNIELLKANLLPAQGISIDLS